MNKVKALVRGFLPEEDPQVHLPRDFEPWEELSHEQSKLLMAGKFRKALLTLPRFPFEKLHSLREEERAMQILSYFGHAYVWGEKETPQNLPAILAVPWYEVGKKLGRPPVLSYASYSLNNWKRLDPKGPIELGNIVLIQNFLGGVDEEWFILVHVEIEAKAAIGLKAMLEAIDASQNDDLEALTSAMQTIKNSLIEILKTLKRMPEKCDPYIYYNRVRPYLHGWKNHRAFPKGLIYDDVKEYKQEPQSFRGETGAQSSIIPSMDGLLGIRHAKDELYHYLQEMREYMPPIHREFVKQIEDSSKVREYVMKHMATNVPLKELYNACVQLVDDFRETHLGYAANYIQKQHQVSTGNPTAVGTGGTPFMDYLKKHRDETTAFLL